eukprot:gb/GECH01001625.1/.p1 GENE.gb/GECH01001625.1/~~gb/GECH01001625.1/.p1  ORF type:complete len:729 (+),score=141.24 gb/GECH01001625.1/:1-2187(+)
MTINQHPLELYADALEKSDASDFLRQLKEASIQTQNKSNNVTHEESITWQLILQLFHGESTFPPETSAKMLKENPALKFDKSIENDTELCKAVIVCEWLERSTMIDVTYSPTPNLWQESRQLAPNATLHPDIPMQIPQSLSAKDIEREQDVLDRVWYCIRSGQIEEAVEVCKRCEQGWRSASLLGCSLLRLPFLSSSLGSPNGNPHYSSFVKACRALADAPEASDTERAIYGALGGSTLGMRRRCVGWRDYLWAELRAGIVTTSLEGTANRGEDTTMEREGADRHRDPNNETGTAVVTEAVRRVSDRMGDGMEAIQAAIACGDLLGTAQTLQHRLQSLRSNDPLRLSLLPFTAHFTEYVVRTLTEEISDQGMLHPAREARDDVVIQYIDHLLFVHRHRRHESNRRLLLSLMPRYVALLSPHRQTEVYARLLTTLEDEEDQPHHEPQHAFNLEQHDSTRSTDAIIADGVRQGLPMEAVCDTVLVEAAQHQDLHRRVRRLQYLVFLPPSLEDQQHGRTVAAGLITRHGHAVLRDLWTAAAAATIPSVWEKEEEKEGKGSIYEEWIGDVVRLLEEEVLHEHNNNSNNSNNSNGGNGNIHDSYSETRLHCQLYHALSAFRRWQRERDAEETRDGVFDDAVRGLQTVLEDGGWGPGGPYRAPGMAEVRHTCVPWMVQCLQQVLDREGHLWDSVVLADLVADEQYQHYETFSGPQLHRLLSTMKQSMLQLAEQD